MNLHPKSVFTLNKSGKQLKERIKLLKYIIKNEDKNPYLKNKQEELELIKVNLEKFLLEIIKLKVQVLYLPVTLIRMMKSLLIKIS